MKIPHMNSTALRRKGSELLEGSRFALKPFLILGAIYLVAILAIIRANYNYVDDLGRIAKGYKEWDYFSRFTAYILSSFVHGDNYMMDISPLPQLLAAALMALAGVMVIWLLTGSKTISIWSILAVVPMGLSPYFLSCLSYKFDAPYMALSVLVSVFPLLFLKKGYAVYGAMSVLGNLLMCTTYQASSGIYPVLVLLLCFRMWNQGTKVKECAEFLGVSAACYVFALLLFKLVIMQPVDEGEYVSGELLPLSQMIPGAVKNWRSYLTLMLEDFKKEWLLCVAFIAAAYVYVSVRDSSRKKVVALLLACGIAGVSFFLSYGAYAVLNNTSHGARAMYGIGGWIAFLGVSGVGPKKTFPVKLACLALSWMFVTFSLSYGNALAEQKRYTDFRVNAVVQDLNELEISVTDTNKRVQIDGGIGRSPVIEHMPQNYNMMNRLIPPTFDGSWRWSKYYFANYFDLRNMEVDLSRSLDLASMELPVLEDTMYHTIRGNEEYIHIILK